MHYDLVICFLPPYPLNSLPAAPAILKACVEHYGFTVKTVDLNQYLYSTHSNRDVEVYNDLANTFHPYIDYANADNRQSIDLFISNSVSKIIELNPKYVGFTVFSSYTHKATYLMCRQLKKQAPHIKIIVGGRGVDVPAKQFKIDIGLPKNVNDVFTTFCNYLREEKLIDYVIIGDGEDALADILLGEHTNTDHRQSADIYSVPVPNYDDYIFEDYILGGDHPIALPVTGSKGCVRNCEFCDVRKQYGKFKSRSGYDIANEMITLSQKYQINMFNTTDSLINGSMSVFTELVTTLANYNNSTDNKIEWGGQYITRPQSQIKPELYKLMKDSGIIRLIIGVESGSDEVLKSINKKIVIKDVMDELEMFSQHGLSCNVNIIPGYWCETWDNFLETLKFFKDVHPYVLDETIKGFAIVLPMVIYDRTLLWDKKDEYGIHVGPYANDHAHMWWSEKNPRLTLKERYYRKLILDRVAFALKYPIADLADTHDYMVKYLTSNADKINEFYKTILPNS
jgi:radical SAM superfamily enzyme YgiQ (UPF0313 family)